MTAVPLQALRRFDRAAAVTAGLAACWFAYLMWLGSAPGSALLRMLIADVVELPFTLGASGVAWIAAERTAGEIRRAWRWIAIAHAALFAGQAIWVLQLATVGLRPPLPSAELAYLIYYPLLLGGLLRFPAAFRSRADRFRFWLDAATVVCAGATIVWYVSVRQLALGSGQALDVAFSTFAYAIGDLVLVVGITSLWLRRRTGPQGLVLTVLGAALFVNFAGDLAWAASMRSSEGTVSSAAGALLMLSYFGVALAAALQPRLAASEPQVGDTPGHPSPLPYVAAIAAYALLLVATMAHGSETVKGLVVGAMLLTLLVLARQLVAVRDNLRLTEAASARVSEARFRALVQHSSDVIAIVSAGGEIRYVSPSVHTVFGHDTDAIVGRPFAELVHHEDVGSLHRLLDEVHRHPDQPASGHWRLRRGDDDWIHVETRGTNLLAEPTIQGIVLNTRDVTERWVLEQQLVHQAFSDPLTGLANRALFLDRTTHALARAIRRPQAVAVLYLDLDNFKNVNDSLGHAEGDRLLVQAAERLNSCVRAVDTIARLGGDEFAVLVEDADDPRALMHVADRITAGLAQPFMLEGKEMFVGASIGIATARDGETADELMRNADVAMYLAKTTGKARCQVFEPHMHAAVLERLELEADLRRAMERREFLMYYQPIVRLHDETLVGLEALVRWQHPRRGLVTPGHFVPLAEETGLIVPLGRWLLHEVCEQGRRWTDGVDGRPGAEGLRLTVNVSPRHLQDPCFVEDVRSAITATGFDPSLLVLEITEGVLMQHTEATLRKLQELKRLGLQLAIDDFGTGYSSLSYLQRFPIDILKIDKSFVDAVGRGASDPVLARAIVALGDTLRLRTVAEGIERTSQHAGLRALGCELGQGFLFAGPLPVDEVEPWLARMQPAAASAKPARQSRRRRAG
jgi:diguanylate cyclase (GGDEF)-like protein/PAS domain S-box-containing protein